MNVSCDGKIPHTSYSEAKTRLDKQRRRKAMDRQPRHVRIVVYRCEACRKWHVGSTIERESS